MFSGFGSVFEMNHEHAIMVFEDNYRCFPIMLMPDTCRKDDANYGGKIFLPPLALARLTMLHIRYPMLFEITNDIDQSTTHTGVLEFTAEEGRVYLPQWAMETIHALLGQLVRITSCDLPLGSFVKIQPQLVDFLDISDPKAVLENALRNFSCLLINDVIQIHYNDTVYGIRVLEGRPESTMHGICVVETDLETEFAPPVGYVEPEYTPQNVSKSRTKPCVSISRGAGAASMAQSIGYARLVTEGATSEQIFTGSGQKLSGNAVIKSTKNVSTNEEKYTVDDLDINAEPVPLRLPINQLFFGFPIVSPRFNDDENEQVGGIDGIRVKFEGAGQLLRQSKKRRDKSALHPALKNHSRSPPDVIELD